ncbi:hypothetical protein AB0J21_06345 [Streptomyces sp. NPDC049954]|uniref:hypothetical protein n=1 Tax=Streptomyces sp. NPDC049954 TaxID=3155779 RepID=UPI00341F7D6A
MAGSLVLGEADVVTVARLGGLLGAPPLGPGVNLGDWRTAHVVAGRLTQAVRAVADGAFLDTFFHPDCVRCDSGPAVTLGGLDLPAAERLTAVLKGTAGGPG